MHGVNTGLAGEPDDLAIAKELMRTCYEMYARTPAGLAPEIVHFVQRDGSDFPKQHELDTGGGDFTVKPNVRPCLDGGFAGTCLKRRSARGLLQRTTTCVCLTIWAQDALPHVLS
jgi:hypothetical protein